MSLEILNKPIYCIVQDKGRFNYSHLGVCVAGVMDEYSFYMANKLLSNEKNTNILEINFSNVLFKVNKDTSIAITGAICEFFINEKLQKTWRTYKVFKGDIIKIGKFISGQRVYLSVKNGFDVASERYGLSSNKLNKGDILKFNEALQINNRAIKEKYIPRYNDKLELRVVLSYQEEYFKEDEKDKFFNSQYIVSNEISRMGYKLKGESINCTIDGIISEAIAFGSIQIPKDGQPIILLKERQTIGGYPKIGVVIDVDCFKLSQAKPNTKITFKQISFKQASDISKEFYLNVI